MSIIKPIPVTMYQVNGQLFDTEEDAEKFISRLAVETLLEEGGELYFGSGSSSTRDIAEYLIERKERVIELLTAIK